MYLGNSIAIILGVILVILIIVFVTIFSFVSINCKKCYNPPLPVSSSLSYSCLNYFFEQIYPQFIGNNIVGSSVFQGCSVSISDNGNVVLSGAVNDNNGVGAAYVFINQNGNYIQYGPKLVGSDYIGQSFQGYGVAISGDGMTIAIGGVEDNNGVGAVWIFVLSLSTFQYVQQGPKLVASNAIGNAYQGSSVRKK
jgi:hypothetical protein